ncbi:MAG: hypothetical protein AVDCRST_MAG01-01-4497, partial [uncultured Rubrobacteraceae bacterium]
GLAIHPGVEGLAPHRQPLNTGVATRQVAPTRELNDDGALLRRREERQGLQLPRRLRGGRAGPRHLHA